MTNNKQNKTKLIGMLRYNTGKLSWTPVLTHLATLTVKINTHTETTRYRQSACKNVSSPSSSLGNATLLRRCTFQGVDCSCRSLLEGHGFHFRHSLRQHSPLKATQLLCISKKKKKCKCNLRARGDGYEVWAPARAADGCRGAAGIWGMQGALDLTCRAWQTAPQPSGIRYILNVNGEIFLGSFMIYTGCRCSFTEEVDRYSLFAIRYFWKNKKELLQRCSRENKTKTELKHFL